MSQAAAATEPEWARTDADPSDGTEEGTESSNPLRSAGDADAEQGNGDAGPLLRPDTDNDDDAELSVPKRPLNRNVKITLCYQPSLNVCTSLATASPLAAYVLLRTGSNARVGYAVGAMGVANLCAAFPAAWLADRWSRTAVIRTAVIIGALGFCALVASVVLGDHIDANKQFLCICASTAIIGCFVGSQSSAVEAIFGDSIPSGARSRLYVRKQSLRVLGTAAGPLLAVVVFATVGDHWREGELEIVIACGACLFFCPALLALALSEKQTLGDLSRPLLADDGDAHDRRQQELRIAATVCVSDVVSMLGSGMTVKFFPLFFWREVGLSPIKVQVIYVLAPTGIACCAFVAQKMSKRIGRVWVTVCTKVSACVLLAVMTKVNDGPLIIVLYLLRTWLANCCSGLTRSILNDYVRKEERARWNAAESINRFGWSGSAVLGGHLVDRYGYRFTFLITAGLQLCSAAILSSLARVVERESSSYARVETSEGETKEEPVDEEGAKPD